MSISDSTDISVCVDCIMLIANGEDEGGHAESMDIVWPSAEGWHLACGGEDLGFSWSSCSGCGSHLGGDRFMATAFNNRTDTEEG